MNSLPRLRFFRLGAWCAMALLLAAATPARAWWDSHWSARKTLTIDTSASGTPVDGIIGAVPVLVRLSDANFRFDAAKPDGADLRFVAADDKTLLPYHIEKLDSLLHEALVWVRVPDVKGGEKISFWLYYGNNENTVVKADDPKATFGDSTLLALHFSEHGQPAFDFSGHGNGAQTAGVADDAAMIGTGLRLEGKNAVNLAPDPAWSDRATLTWSAWVNVAASQSNAVIYGRRTKQRAFFVGADNGVLFAQVTDTAGTRRSSGGTPVALGKWHHLAIVFNAASGTVYVDGVPYGTLDGSVPGLDTAAVLGGESFGSAGFVGGLDELEIANVARPVGFIRFVAASQGPDGARLISYGAEEQPSSWLGFLKNGYLGIIIGSLTVDGWVVIGILGIMSIVSWTVMLRKAAYLNSVSKGNAEFLEHWRQIAGDLSVLDQEDVDFARTMGGRLGPGRRGKPMPPLYHIYHLGIEETRMRIAGEGPAGSRALSARSIQAIRAVLDGGMVRETQELNNGMVLLTIAISGGPFLGLLGTVIGVMITFAAVAAAGDVNVNAIAPGIAAALAATVAGLAVAIPALFGYNYLLTRVKAMTSDMHVFIDEFVTRLAEFYSEPVA